MSNLCVQRLVVNVFMLNKCWNTFGLFHWNWNGGV